MVVVVVVAVIIGWRSDGCYEMVSRCRRSPMYESQGASVNNRSPLPEKKKSNML